ncbi:MAG: PilZ domain-containing protein [Candidatus Omnitrophica bacterium]|nr:PilZ domain-containing protein [Candidatus Omnitrophota bacterium]
MGIFGLSFKEKKVWNSIAPANKISVRLKESPHDVYRSNVIEVTKKILMIKTPMLGMVYLEIMPNTVAMLEVEILNPLNGRIFFSSKIISQEWMKERTTRIAVPRSIKWVQLRRCFRLEIVLDCEYALTGARSPKDKFDLTSPVLFGLVRNISELGVFLITENIINIDVGTQLNLKVNLAPGLLFRGRGKVLRIEKVGDKFGLGIEFLATRENDREMLRKFIFSTDRKWNIRTQEQEAK